MDSSQANDYNNPEFSDTDEAIEKSAPENTSSPDHVQRKSPPENKSASAMARDEERKIYCDWGQVGLCVIPENPHLDKSIISARSLMFISADFRKVHQ